MIKLWGFQHNEIIQLAEQGHTASYIKDTLKLPISLRQVQRIIAAGTGRAKRPALCSSCRRQLVAEPTR